MAIRDTSYHNSELIALLGSSVFDRRTYQSIAKHSSSLYISGDRTPSSGAYAFYPNTIGIVDKINLGSKSIQRVYENSTETSNNTSVNSIAINSSGSMFLLERNTSTAFLSIKQSHISSSVWTSILSASGTAGVMNIDSQDRMYFSFSRVPNWFIFSSSDKGQTWGTGTLDSVDVTGSSNEISFDSSNGVYIAGDKFVGGTRGTIKFSNNSGSTWTEVLIFTGSGAGGVSFESVLVDTSTGRVYASTSGNGAQWKILSSSNGASGSFGVCFSDTAGDFTTSTRKLARNNSGIYCLGTSGSFTSGSNRAVLKCSTDNGVSWSDAYYNIPGKENIFNEFFIYPSAVAENNELYIVGGNYAGNTPKEPFVLKVVRTANSATLGPRMLATSFVYSKGDPDSNKVYLGFANKLNNISEFPHSSGLFQMPNLVLGTKMYGKTGNNSDCLIQVNYFGSVVKVLWPLQDSDILVTGFGDMAPGQKPGKLTTDFVSGEFINVTEYDQMSLYCYLIKEESGTLDNIDIRIERRPLKSTGFATEQSIEYSTSGSVTIGELRDIVYRKEVDYGDLSIREVAFSIDTSLTNVKEIRISARQLTGQADDKNKNFVVWGRFINSEEET